jgi:UMF1 family MFS transporter
MSAPPVTKREIFGWCCFDFANSSYTTVITTVVFARYFTGVIAKDSANPVFLWGLAGALSNILVIFLGPWLGALADRTGRKKHFLMATATCCSLATAALWFTGADTVTLALVLVVFSHVNFSLGENFNASFLPELSTPANAGKVSGYGWAFGYFGGLTSLFLSLGLVEIDVRLVFPAVGAFFIIATIPTMLLLKERAPRRPAPPLFQLFADGWRETFHYLRVLPQRAVLFRFLISFFVFMMGVTCVISFAGIYASLEFGFDTAGVIKLFIFLQLSAAAGAFLFGFFQDKFGSLPTLALSLVGWLVVAAGAGFVRSQEGFFAVALLAGAVIGSTQSASRALISTLAPADAPAETFGYWGFFGKFAAIIGPPVFGFVADGWGMRTAIFGTGIYFLIGLVLLLTIRLPKAEVE